MVLRRPAASHGGHSLGNTAIKMVLLLDLEGIMIFATISAACLVRSIMEALLVLWLLCWGVQACFSLGTAYRYTKRGGDNGLALWGWMFVFGCSSMVPGLGLYFWYKTRLQQDAGARQTHVQQATQVPVVYITQPATQSVPNKSGAVPAVVAVAAGPLHDTRPICPSCGSILPNDSVFCEHCGTRLPERLSSSSQGA